MPMATQTSALTNKTLHQLNVGYKGTGTVLFQKPLTQRNSVSYTQWSQTWYICLQMLHQPATSDRGSAQFTPRDRINQEN